jgi:glutathione S-transferase
MSLFWGYYRQPPERRDNVAVEAARKACAEDYALLDAELGDHLYLAGDAFTLADIPAGATLFRYLEMGLDVPRPAHVMAWYERLQTRASYQRWIMAPFEELSGRSTY